MPPRNRRLTFGLMLDSISSWGDQDYFQSIVISGVADFAKRYDINLVCFVAGKIVSPYEWERSRNIMLDFVDPQQIDGLIVLSTAIGVYVPKSSILELLKRYEGIPIVTIGEAYDDYYSVSANNYSGMRQVVDHLIEVHKCKRIAFIKGAAGNLETDIRFNAYQEALTDHRIPLDPNLICQGNYLYESGVTAIRQLVASGIEFDAIISSNDNMALGAMTEINRQFGKVPDNLPITGFDDAAFAKQLDLTTVRQSFFDEAVLAASILYRKLNNEEIPVKNFEISTEMVLRSTCGCIPSIITNATVTPEAPHDRRILESDEMKADLFAEMREINKNLGVELSPEDLHLIEEKGRTLVDLLLNDLLGKRDGVFYLTWNSFINWVIRQKGNLNCLHDLLSCVRRHILRMLTDPMEILYAENVFQGARVQIGDAVHRDKANNHYFASLNDSHLDQLSEELVVNLDMNRQIELACEAFGRHQIISSYIALYEDPEHPMESAKLVLAYENGVRLELPESGIVFPTAKLLPEPFLSGMTGKRHNIVIQSLHHGDSQIGFAIFGFENHINKAFEIIRHRLSIAFKSAILMTNTKNHAAELEKQVLARTKELSVTNQKLLQEIGRREEAEQQLRKALYDLAMLNEDLQVQSVRDELTGLLNRRGFMSRGEQIFQKSSMDGLPFLLMYADLDRLKMINDLHGHVEGDRALVATAEILKNALPNTAIIARLGGDEFTVILNTDTPGEYADVIRSHIQQALDQYNQSQKLPYTLSFSIGFSLYEPGTHATFGELLKIADDEMYTEKLKRRELIK